MNNPARRDEIICFDKGSYIWTKESKSKFKDMSGNRGLRGSKVTMKPHLPHKRMNSDRDESDILEGTDEEDAQLPLQSYS